jgi:hypothetical protein
VKKEQPIDKIMANRTTGDGVMMLSKTPAFSERKSILLLDFFLHICLQMKINCSFTGTTPSLEAALLFHLSFAKKSPSLLWTVDY